MGSRYLHLYDATLIPGRDSTFMAGPPATNPTMPLQRPLTGLVPAQGAARHSCPSCNQMELMYLAIGAVVLFLVLRQ